MAKTKVQAEARKRLVGALGVLTDTGRMIDEALTDLELEAAAHPPADETRLQILGALSREVWDAQRMVGLAIAACHQLDRLPDG